MALHRLTHVAIGVPDVALARAYYEDFGLEARGDGWLASEDGGEQLRLLPSPRRRCLEIGIGCDDADDVERVAASLARLGCAVERSAEGVAALDPGTAVRASIRTAPRLAPPERKAAATNGPGCVGRRGLRADAVMRERPARPFKLGHVVLGSTEFDATQRFFVEGLGFKISDSIAGLASFLRCSTDHHNLLVQPAPIPLLHHTSWQMADVDEVGRAAQRMLAKDPARHVWGLGRHHVGSNFFWYLKDPAGNFTEYYADLDCIPEDALWEPGVWDGAKSLYSWGPPVPASFLAPDDLAELMAQAHA
jgi:catechol 2,3-dioxygenase-like lactoylglutathione lyase family enzyme